MKMLNQVKMTFASRSVNESFSRAALAAFLAQADPTVPQLADIKTAVSEAVTNCIVHAYPDTVGPITMTAVLYEGGNVRITISDKGVGIPDVAKAMEPMDCGTLCGKGTLNSGFIEPNRCRCHKALLL